MHADGRRMATGFEALTEKEKQTLRLIVRGHDAKSMARHLGLSVHTVNERLRDARRKLAVSSSREAARLLLDCEDRPPESVGDKAIGEAAAPGVVAGAAAPAGGPAPASRGGARRAWLITGAALMSLILAILALAAAPPQSAGDTAPTAAAAPAETAPVETAAVRAARAWLALHDASRWPETYAATSTEFRKLNTLARWTAAAQQARTPLGAMQSRTLVSREEVPAPPAGVEVVKFRTDYANKPGAIETVSLAPENGTWKVVGIYLE